MASKTTTMISSREAGTGTAMTRIPNKRRCKMVTFESFSAQFLNQNRDHWEGTAAVNGEFKYLKMTDSRGKYLVFFFYPLDLWVLDVGILFD
ncbi:thioredoxin-dependent peroxide reductase, mitochondrial-like isoform X4 [Pocillopora verrucosa]|uniref:thioredoxin-dependent peroxide reductase, mitochondrial-like isoform X4 n=1 Tax=Pocillopora verrucosa TaxID=203993 RepID=UPI00333EAFAE